MAETILVVDDDVDSLKLIKQMLQRQGYHVLVASGGRPALQAAFQDMPDLIILDIMMPDIDGYEVCRRLRADEKTAAIPIVMFTAKTMVDDKVAGFEAGADDYLTKPIHPAELSSRVKAILQRSQHKTVDSESVKTVRGEKSGVTLAFLGVKGGVGTTTLAINVAAILAQQNTTLLADLRPGQGTLGLSLGFGRAQSMATILNRPAAEITLRLIQEQIVTHSSGINLLLSSIRPQETQINIAPEAISKLLASIKDLAYFRLIDLGTGLTRLSAGVMRESDHAVILIEPNRVTLTLAREILKELDQLGISATRYSIVIFNRVQSTAHVPWQEVEQILSHEVAAIISPAPELAAQATENAVPLVQYQPNSIVAGQVAKLAEEFAKRGNK